MRQRRQPPPRQQIRLDDRHDAHGRAADAPQQIPARGWKDVAVRVKEESKADNLVLLSAGVAFFGLLALVPAIVAAVSIYGLVGDPALVEERVDDLLAAAPQEARDLLTEQLSSIVDSSSTGLGLAAIGGIVLALWSASSGMKHLIEAVNMTYDEDERRGFLRVRGLAILLTLGAIGFVVAAFFAIAILPSLVDDLAAPIRWLVGALRWVALFAGMMAGLAIVYRYAPDRDEPKWRWVSWGAVVATVVWLAASFAFSIYTRNFGSYNETYGSMGGVIVLMLWLLVTALCVLLGAEVNAELERQTKQDTTRGPDRPLGTRDAFAADTVGREA